jgi:hypothetical protein
MIVQLMPEIHSLSYKNEPQTKEDSEKHSKSKNRKNKT